jgi:hypothetical protein
MVRHVRANYRTRGAKPRASPITPGLVATPIVTTTTNFHRQEPQAGRHGGTVDAAPLAIFRAVPRTRVNVHSHHDTAVGRNTGSFAGAGKSEADTGASQWDWLLSRYLLAPAGKC